VLSVKKDFISLADAGTEEINYILNTAETMKLVLNQKNKKAPHLQGKAVIMLFFEKSSRTRLSFQLAAQYLSAGIVDMTGEYFDGTFLKDMGNIIDQMGGDYIIIRHPMSGSAKLLADNVTASVINAGDGMNENPSQALLDLLTIKTMKGGFKGLKVAVIGDVLHSRVTHSNIWALPKLGACVTLAGPPTLVPDEFAGFGVRIMYDVTEAINGADVIMVLRVPAEKDYGNLLPSMNEYKNFFGVDEKIIKYAKPDVIVMHPGPVNRGFEISSGVADSNRCHVDDQITNGVAVRMALLYLLSLRKGEEPA